MIPKKKMRRTLAQRSGRVKEKRPRKAAPHRMNSRSSATIAGMYAPVILALLLSAAPGGVREDDPLVQVLEEEDAAARNASAAEILKSRGGDPCTALSACSRIRSATAREHAVRLMGVLACRSMEDYRPYFDDGSGWVADALLSAIAQNRVEEAVPYALARLDDHRRLVSDDGSWTLAQAAHKALQALTGQPISIDAAQAPGGRADSGPAAWRAWYRAHKDEDSVEWIAAGLRRIREAVASDSGPARVEAVETLAQVGEPGEALLKETLRRAPGDLVASLVCAPEEPPRVTEKIPCTFVLRNATSHRVVVAAGEVGVQLQRSEPPPSPQAEEPRHPVPKSKVAPAVAPPDPVPGVHFDPSRLSGRIVDLGPGESLRRLLQVGPVTSSGRYEIKARLDDLGPGILAVGGFETVAAPIETSTIVRFEQ